MSLWSSFISQNNANTFNEVEDIKYHLTKLLESEASLLYIDDRFVELNRSNHRFGIEDIQLLSASLDQTQLAMRIETWVSQFEPRLHDVSVELVERKASENAIAFNIIAKVNTSQGETELVFDSKIALNDLSTSLSEDSYE
ncbi:type VI secretion system baseplate subunit TssE [Vibrio sp. ZSDE26]|uniref:Type VI secretion system baseplate subunit TssE n=1 Tax=Vibrio amylolyticus TaxID=2847292 RepID=A0A9X2BJF4_9VIBR|nr:type VI secretion system baseplate subunit TssE [Vibrio amylolyticus]MCK6265160.1 type VI secretion system baseplate subunit TssE [Vibrio amylolyticus]